MLKPIKLCLVLVFAVGLLLPGKHFATAGPPDWDVANGHFYTQTGNNSGRGYAVVDDDVARLWTEYQRLGGPQVLGYPVSRRFLWNGNVHQAMQRAVLIWRADTKKVDLLNIFDVMTEFGVDQQLLESAQIPLPAQWNEAGLTPEQIAKQRLAVMDNYPAIRRAYQIAPGDPVAWYGLPTSGVVDMGNHYALRTQRAVFQQWKETMPFAKAGEVTTALGGSLLIKTLPFPAEVTALEEPLPAIKKEDPPAATPGREGYGWFGEAADTLNVRSAPNTGGRIVRTIAPGQPVTVFEWVEGEAAVGGNRVWGRVGPGEFVYSYNLRKPLPAVPPPPPADAPRQGDWIDANLTQQILTAYNGSRPVYWAVMSSGRPSFPSPTGLWKILYRVENETMDSATLNIEDTYRIENVYWTQYYTSFGDAIHYNYWKYDSPFGVPSSHGCFGLQREDSLWFWNWARVGTPVYVHY